MDINNIYQVALICTAICGAFVYLFSQVRKQDIDGLRGANNDLRLSIQDKTQRIEELEDSTVLLQKNVSLLNEKVNDLEAKNNDLGTLVKESLVLYFKNNPTIAKDMVTKI